MQHPQPKLLAILTVFACTQLPAEQIVLIPDSQAYIRATENHHILQQQTQWIADNLEAENIALISHVGDIITGSQRGNSLAIDEQWQVAYENYQQFDGSAPYSFVYGNHDFDEFGNSSGGSLKAQANFGAQRYQGFDWFGGTSEDGENFYQFFEIDGQELLHVGIKFDPDKPTLDWAAELIQEINLPTIITTHAYLTDEGFSQRLGGEVQGGREPIGEFIWKNLIRTNDQIFMVLCGHNHSGESPEISGEYTEDGEHHQVSLNDQGREVYEILANYQDYPNGGDGWFQLVDIDSENSRISVRTWSAYLNKFQEDAMSLYEWDTDLRTRWEM